MPGQKRKALDMEHAEAIEDEGDKVCVVLDMDECLVQTGPTSVFHSGFLLEYGRNSTVPVGGFVKHYLARGGARPWLMELLKMLKDWLDQGRIDKVIIYTASPNESGWVTFMQQCLEVYAGTPGLFGDCLSRKDCELVHLEQGGRAYQKDLMKIGSGYKVRVMVDDKPEHVRNGFKIGVTAYTQKVNMDAMYKWAKELLPTHWAQISAALKEDSELYPGSCEDQSQDDSLWLAAEALAEACPPRCNPAKVSTGLRQPELPHNPLLRYYRGGVLNQLE